MIELINEELEYLYEMFSNFFSENNYRLKSKESATLTFQNSKSLLIIRYELNNYSDILAMTHIMIVNKKNNQRYLVDDIINYLNPNLNLEQLLEDYKKGFETGETMSEDIAYLHILNLYLSQVMKYGDFRWEGKVNPTQLI